MKKTVLFAAFFVAIFVFSMTLISYSQPLPNPVVYNSFIGFPNGTPNDVSGNENHETVIENTILTEYILFL